MPTPPQLRSVRKVAESERLLFAQPGPAVGACGFESVVRIKAIGLAGKEGANTVQAALRNVRGNSGGCC